VSLGCRGDGSVDTQTVYSLLFPSFSSIMADNNNNQCVKASKYDVIKALVALVTNVKWRWWLYDEK